MALIYAGIDEAGYGPLLGPLCVGLCVLRVDGWSDGTAVGGGGVEGGGGSGGGAPDLWKLLSGAVCREPGDRRRRIAIDDSKKLKLGNSGKKHPLVHLERGVLSFLLCKMHEEALARGDTEPPLIADDAEFFRRIGVTLPCEAWYETCGQGNGALPTAFPGGAGADELAIARSVLARELAAKGVKLEALRCEAIGEGVFNEIVEAAGTKAAATESALVAHLHTVWETFAGRADDGDSRAVRVVCDRQGGRANYAPMLERAFPGVRVVETHCTATQSRYELSSSTPGDARTMHVLFLTESERAHLPVALASMLAKLTRETLMARFNRYWQARLPELKPTAGYRQDGWRWMQEAGEVISADERRMLVRRA